jgi:hypothetical protein
MGSSAERKPLAEVEDLGALKREMIALGRSSAEFERRDREEAKAQREADWKRRRERGAVPRRPRRRQGVGGRV